MDIDKNDIRILANRIPKILIESSSALLKRNPKASFAWFSIFVSYIFFPRILWFLIYILPFIVLITAISIKTYVSVRKESDAKKNEEAKDGKSPGKVQSAEDESDDNRTYNAKHARSVRRRKSKVVFAEIGQDSIQEKEAICSTNFTNDLIDKRALLEETIKDIREVEASVVNDHVESSPSAVSLDFQSRFNLLMRSQAFADLNTDGVSSENTEDQGDATREERTANRGVEDDQKTIADLGLSEIERNKRLESLIARRRAKNILSLPIRRAIINMGNNDSRGQNIYPIVIQKSNPTSPRSDQFIPGPISAPSGSSNIRNPFDLPYEPHEERPNLTSDGFHQEFFGSHPKDTMLCRHESSSLGGTPPGNLRHNLPRTPLPNKHGKKKEIVRRKEKTECQSGESNEEKKVEQEQSQSQEVECDDKVENTDQGIEGQVSTQEPDLDSVSHEDLQNKVTKKSVIIEGCNRLSLSSSSEEDEPISRLDKERILRSLSSPRPANMYILSGGGRFHDILLDYGSPETEKTERTGRFDFPDHNNHHIRSHSIASDMQVEVSEIGSPPDMNISSPDEVRSLSVGKFEKEIPDSEDMWISSSQFLGVDENESRSREIHEVGDKDTVGVGFSTIKESKIPIERVIAQDSSSPRPNFVSDSKIPGNTDANKDFIEHIIREQPSTSCPYSSHDMKPKVLQSHEEQQLTGTSMTDHFGDSDLHNPQVPSSPPGNPTEELNINFSSSNLHAQNSDDDVRSIQTLENECKRADSHESDEVIDSIRSQEKLRENVEHPLEAEIHNKNTSEDVIQNEDAGKNVDGDSLFSHNTVNNGIHGEIQNSESGSRLHLLLNREAQSLQEHPCADSEKSDKSGSMLQIDNLLDLQNSSQVNLITNEEVDNNISCEQGDLQAPGEVQLEDYHRPARADVSTGESSQPGFTREVEEISEEMPQQTEMPQQMEMPQPMSTEGNYNLVSTPDTEDEESSIAIVTSEPNQFVIQPNEVLSPELETEQVPTALSTSSSPKSVLTPRLPGDQGSVSNLSDDIQMANQHSGGESSGSNSSSPPSQTAPPSTEDQTTYQSHERIQEPSISQLLPAEKATSTSGCLNSRDIDTNSMDHRQKQTSEASSSYTNTENQETNLDTISSNKEEIDQSNPSTSHYSELEKG